MRALTFVALASFSMCGTTYVPVTSSASPGSFCRQVSNCYPLTPVYFADADDLVGGMGASIASWTSPKGPSLAPSTADAQHEPSILTNAINGHPAAHFSGAYNSIDFNGAAALATPILQTWRFDAFMVVRINTAQDTNDLIQTTTTSSLAGWELYQTSAAKIGGAFAPGTGGTNVAKESAAALSQGVWHLIEWTGDGATYQLSVDGGAFTDATAFSGTPAPGDADHTPRLGASSSASFFTDMDVALVAVYARQLSSGERTTLRNTVNAKYGTMPVTPSKRIAVLGDSILLGSHCNFPPGTKIEQTANTNVAASTAVGNFGVGGYTTSQIYTKWTSAVKTRGYTHIVLLGCINDLANAADNSGAQSTAEALCETKIGAIITEARADTSGTAGGIEVAVATMTPWSTFSGSSANRQTATQTFNAWVRTQASAHVHVVELAADATLGTGTLTVPGALNAPMDSGDGGHPSQAGSDRIAALYVAGLSL